MAKGKRTFSVEEFKDSINKTLASYEEKEASHDFIQGLRAALEGVLKTTGNYQGYEFLGIDEVPNGERPGVWSNYMSSGRFEYSHKHSRLIDKAYEGTDANRVKYR